MMDYCLVAFVALAILATAGICSIAASLDKIASYCQGKIQGEDEGE